MTRALLVEDDLDLARAIVDYLELEEIACDHAGNGVAALELARGSEFDMMILDLNLPRMDGLDVCSHLRDEGNDVPILMLTARDSLDDKLSGFDRGTDDYLVKPFAMDELLARVRALAGRRSSQTKRLTVGDLELNLTQRHAYRAGERLRLSPTGFKILEYLMRASPNPVGRASLVEAVWGDGQPDSDSLRVHIHNLRKHLDELGGGPLLHTVAGFGYQVKADDEDSIQS